ncbi:MAG: hypothetical protein WC625_04720 [Caldisericia bacterium]
MKRVSRTAVWFVIVTLLVAAGVERPSRVSGLDDSISESVLATWRIGQTSDMSDEAKIRATVDTFFQLDYANRTTTTFVSRSFLMAVDTDAARIFARYTDGLLKYKILCWSALDALPVGYEDYRPEYREVTVDATGSSSSVTVLPICTFRYDRAQASKEYWGYQTHILTLHKVDGTWRIESEETLDWPERKEFPLDTDFEKLTRELPTALAKAKLYEDELDRRKQQDIETMRKNNDPRLHFMSQRDGGDMPSEPVVGNGEELLSGGYITYDRSRAALYTRWATGISPRTGLVGWGNNPLFPSYPGDCINFGSQVVWFGFGGINDSAHINSHAVPMVTTGGRPWYQGLTTWITLVSYDPDSFLPMINSNLYYDLVGVQGWWYGSLGGIAPGDIVVRTQSYWHAMPVSAVVDKHSTPWTTELDEIYISSHTDPAYDTRLIDFMPSIIGHPEYCAFVNINLYKMP